MQEVKKAESEFQAARKVAIMSRKVAKFIKKENKSDSEIVEMDELGEPIEDIVANSSNVFEDDELVDIGALITQTA